MRRAPAIVPAAMPPCYGVSLTITRMTRVEIDGAGLEVVHLTAPDGGQQRAPIVFLHEGLGSVAMWRDWPQTVCNATGRDGWLYSRRGYGQSDAVPDVRGPPTLRDGLRRGRLQPDYMHHEALAVLPALLHHLGVERPVLLGHSDGASIALLYASRHALTACIAMAPHVMVEELSIRSIEQARRAYECADLRQRLAKYHSDVDNAFWQWNDAWLDPAFRDFDIRDDCRGIEAPVLAIQGTDDPYGTLAQIEQIVLPPSRLARVVLEHCGHSAHRDQPLATTRLIADFLAPLA